MAKKQLPWIKWNEADFFAQPLVPRMSPQARLHLRSLLQSSLAQNEPWLVDDGRLWRLADAVSLEAWTAIKDEVLEEFVLREDGAIAHPLALAISEDRAAVSSQRSKASRVRWVPAAPRDLDEPTDPASPEARTLAEQLCLLNYDATVEIEDSACALLDSLLQEKGHSTVKQVTNWLLTAPEAGEFYREQQFAGCASPEAIVRSFAKGFDRIAQNALRKTKKPSKSAEQADTVLSRYGR